MIRQAEHNDWDQIWSILQPVFAEGETYAFSPDISKSDARIVWLEAPQETFVWVDATEKVLATYYLKPNQPELGAHVCNCGYVVSPQAQGQGIASRMCEHSQARAKELGFRAMQFNLVAATNVGAIRLWKKLGYYEVGCLKKAFKSLSMGYVDAFVMYKELT